MCSYRDLCRAGACAALAIYYAIWGLSVYASCFSDPLFALAPFHAARYFAPWARVAWFAAFAVVPPLFLLAARVPRKIAFAARGLIPALFLASLFLLQTDTPSMHGDGEGGVPPYMAEPQVFPLHPYHRYNARLDALLGWTTWKLLGAAGYDPEIRYPLAIVDQQAPLVVESYMAMQRGVLLLLALAMGIWLYRGRHGDGRAVAAACFLFGPPFVGAYGYFDSYVVPTATVTLWFMLLLRARREDRSCVPPFLAALLAAYAHPLMGVLIAATGIFALAKKTRFRPAELDVAALGAAVAFACIYVDSLKNPYLLSAGNLAFCLFALCISSLPGIFAALASKLRPSVPGDIALHRAGLLLLSCFPLMFFTLGMGQGVMDEFLYGVLGAAVLAGGMAVCRAHAALPRGLALAAVLAVFLTFPRTWTHASIETDSKWFNDVIWQQASGYGLDIPASVALGLHIPITTEEGRKARLEAFRRGALDVPEDKKHQWLCCALYYVAWSYEFESVSPEADRILDYLVKNVPSSLENLLRPGAMFTDRYRDRARFRIAARLGIDMPMPAPKRDGHFESSRHVRIAYGD